MALAESTKVKYSQHAQYWVRFCSIFGLSEYILAPTEAVACAFVGWLSFTNGFSSVRVTLSGLRNFWRERGVQISTESWFALHRVVKGLKRDNGAAPTRKRPISPADLRGFHARMTDSSFSTAIWACMLITWWGMLRKSNTTTGYRNHMDASAVILAADVRVLHSEWALELRIRKSKTNQYRDRVHVIILQGCRQHPLDPVQAWLAHALTNHPMAVEPAFSFTEIDVRQSITHDLLVKATKLLFVASGGDAREVSGHSYRRGGATFAFMSGVPDILIQRQGDWASLAYRMYVDMSTESLRQTTSKMFANLLSHAEGSNGAYPPAVAPLGHVIATEQPLAGW